MSSALRAGVILVLLMGLAVASVQVASATVTTTVSASPDPIFTGQQVTLSWTKASDDVGDGAQAGNVQASYTGPKAGTLSNQAYSFAGGASTTKTWTWYTAHPGTYTFTFADTPSSGPDQDQTLDVIVTSFATRDWSASIVPSSGHDEIHFEEAEVGPDGVIYVSMRQEKQDLATFDGRIAAFNPEGDLVATAFQVCSATVDCYYYAAGPDGAGRVLVSSAADIAGTYVDTALLVMAPSNLAVLDEFLLNEQPPSFSEFDTRKIANNEMAYFLPGDNGLSYRYSSDGTLVWTSSGTGTGNSLLFWDSTSNGIVVSGSCGAGVSCVKTINAETGVVSGTATSLGSGFGPNNEEDFKRSQTTDQKAYITGGGGGASLAWRSIIPGATPTVSSATTFTPGCPIDEGAAAAGICTNEGFDVSGADKFLVCGGMTEADTSDVVGFVGYYDKDAVSGNKLQFWLKDVPTSTAGSTEACIFDFEGGFYTVTELPDGACSCAIRVSHYTLPPGGAVVLTDPVPPEQATGLPTTEAQAGGGGNGSVVAGTDVAGGLSGFCSSLMGDSVASLFFCGLIFVIAVFLALAAAFAALTKSMGLSTAIAGSIGALGMMLFNVFAGIWEAWAGIVLIMLAAGVIAAIARQLGTGGGVSPGQNGN